MSTSTRPYHHGDLRAALLSAARESLEEGETFSMRAIARRAGVSAAAPYRHFADRRALESAVAVDGLAELQHALERSLVRLREKSAVEIVTALSVTYVMFALHHRAVFRLMFGDAADPHDRARLTATRDLHVMLDDRMSAVLPGSSESGLATALWSTAHGLACLHLDGNLSTSPQSAVFERVHGVVAALFAMGHTSTE